MPLSVPSHIANAHIDSNEVRYAWDEWADKDDIYHRASDQSLREGVTPLSQRGRIALANGVAEWLVYRFSPLLENRLPFDALEAAWAGVVDRKYVLPLASFRDDDQEAWSGPVMGVIRRGLLFVNDIIDLGWERGETRGLFIRLTNLTGYVLPQTAEFEAWLATVIGRLAGISPRTPSDWVGDVVPREALDLRRQVEPESTERLIQEFLATLTPKANPFLASRKTMVDWGFKGEPYRFDMAADREARRTWPEEE
jgi:hypothetical protein